MVDNFRQFMGRGRGGFRWPQCAAHAAKKRPTIAGARAETLRGHAQGATSPVLDPPTARGEHFAATDLMSGTEAQPGGKMLVCGPCMPIEADLCEDDMDRGGLSPRHWREIDAGDPVEMGPQIKGGFVALGAPMRGRRWGEGVFVGIDQRSTGTQDALDFLIAGRDWLVRKVIQRERLCEREDMFGPVSPLQGFGTGVCTGLHALVAGRGSDPRIAFPSHNGAENAPARHPGHSTHHVRQVEMHVSE